MDAPDPASMRQTDVEPFSYTGASAMKISTISIDLAKQLNEASQNIKNGWPCLENKNLPQKRYIQTAVEPNVKKKSYGRSNR